jgi:hypothetical protein
MPGQLCCWWKGPSDHLNSHPSCFSLPENKFLQCRKTRIEAGYTGKKKERLKMETETDKRVWKEEQYEEKQKD